MSIESDLPQIDDRSVAVRVRDEEQCQACKRNAGQARQLHVHQIVPGEEAAKYLSNYILLCSRCHRAAHEDKHPSEIEPKHGS